MKLTDKPFLPELSPNERMFLEALTRHEGFPVLQKLFDEGCRMATEDIVKVDPESADYDRIVAARATRARNINEFCNAIRKTFNYHRMISEQDQIKEKANARSNSAN